MSQSPVGVPHRHPIHIDRRITWPRVTTIWTNLVLPRWPLCYCHLRNLMMYLQYFRQNTNMNKRKISQSFILFIRFNLNLPFIQIFQVSHISVHAKPPESKSKLNTQDIQGSHIGKPNMYLQWWHSVQRMLVQVALSRSLWGTCISPFIYLAFQQWHQETNNI